jgi:glucose 1-dehydrogenase
VGVLAGKVAVVTGASTGIGRAIAQALARAGADVALNFLKHRAEAEALAQETRGLGRKAILLEVDIADERAVEAMVAQTAAELGRLDIFVANAFYSEEALFHEADPAGFRRTIDVTMWGAFHGLRAAARQMVRQGTGGNIVFISSVHALDAMPTSMAYNMAKAAVDQMARTAALELCEQGIRVNIVYPGWTDTPGERKYFSEKELQAEAAKLPLGRLARPDEVARGVLFLLDPASEYVIGSTLSIDCEPHVPPT